MISIVEKGVFALLILFVLMGFCYAQVTTSNLHLVEQNLFSTTFISDSTASRLSRIESAVFGESFTDTTASRIKRLNSLGYDLSNSNSYRTPQKHNYSGNNQPGYNSSETDYPKISIIEKKLFNKDYKNQNIYNRLNRIEKSLFGRAFSGNNLSDRVDRIANASVKGSSSSTLSGRQAQYETNSELNGSQVKQNDLAEMEQRIFNRTYQTDDPITRVERLESNIFGAIQSGDPQKRIKTLKLGSQKQYLAQFGYWDKDIVSGESNFPNPYCSNNTSGLLDHAWSGINNVFGRGTSTTGQSATTSDDPFDDPFFTDDFSGSTSSYGNMYNGPTRKYYRKKKSRYGSGVGVRILD